MTLVQEKNEMQNVFDILTERGFVFQTTSNDVSEKLESPITFYVGFDTTADSLHVGHLLPIMGMRWLQKFGHTPIALVGGATAIVGDPTGRTSSRPIMTTETINTNVQGIKEQLSKLLNFNPSISNPAILVNNNWWLEQVNYLSFLREFGAMFNVNRMLQMDSVKSRLEQKDGLSFLEFNYMILQAFDFFHLKQSYNCTFQFGGQDQWGNILSGIELTRKKLSEEVFGVTFPLLLKSNGEKFGKSAGGSIWLDQNKTSAFDFFQFWRNCDDSDVRKLLLFFTELPKDEINSIIDVNINKAKEILAFEITKLVHSKKDAINAFTMCVNSFGTSDPNMQIKTSSDICYIEETPVTKIERDVIGEIIKLPSLLVALKMCETTTEARQLINGLAVSIDGVKTRDVNSWFTVQDFQTPKLIKVGKKKQIKIVVE